MFTCAVCDDRVFTTALCKECVKLRHAMTLYGKDHVRKTINTIFIRDERGIQKQEAAVLAAAAADGAARAT